MTLLAQAVSSATASLLVSCLAVGLGAPLQRASHPSQPQAAQLQAQSPGQHGSRFPSCQLPQQLVVELTFLSFQVWPHAQCAAGWQGVLTTGGPLSQSAFSLAASWACPWPCCTWAVESRSWSRTGDAGPPRACPRRCSRWRWSATRRMWRASSCGECFAAFQRSKQDLHRADSALTLYVLCLPEGRISFTSACTTGSLTGRLCVPTCPGWSTRRPACCWTSAFCCRSLPSDCAAQVQKKGRGEHRRA